MLSADAGLIGNLVGPEDAYRFARGETVTSSTGQRARLVRPLDFLVVADHAQNFGLAPMLEEGNPIVLDTESARARTTRRSLNGPARFTLKIRSTSLK